MNKQQTILTAILFMVAISVFSQKKPLDHSVYDYWERIEHVYMSPGGRYVGYEINPQEGDGNIYFRSLKNKKFNISVARGHKAMLFDDGTAYCLIRHTLAQTRKAGEDKKDLCDSLAVVDIKKGRIKKYPDVKSFSRSGSGVISFSYSNKSLTIRRYHKEGMDSLLIDKGDEFYSKPVISHDGSTMAYMFSSGKNDNCGLRIVGPDGDKKTLLEKNYSLDGKALCSKSKLYFSDNDRRLFITMRDVQREDTLPSYKQVCVNIWRWDSDILPTQEKFARKDFMAVIDIDKKESSPVMLTKSKFDRILPLDGGNADTALSISDAEYQRPRLWDANNKCDLAMVSLEDGSRKEILKGLDAEVSLSPCGKYIIWFNYDTAAWYTYNVESGAVSSLTDGLGVRFENEEEDRPQKAESYDSPSWIQDDEAVILADRYDLWKISPDGKERECLTRGSGRRNKWMMRLRDFRQYPSENRLPGWERAFSEKKEYDLDVYDDDDCRRGMGTIKLDKPRIPEAFVDSFTYCHRSKSADGKSFVYAKGNFRNSYDLYTQKGERLTHTNPWQKDFRWGTAHQVRWTAYDGTPLRGILYVPDDIDTTKTYPLISYFYERRSDQIYRYFRPEPSWSTFNRTLYVSRGYAVFVPDIIYNKVGHPGECAYNCIVSGVEAMAERYKWIDKKHLAIQGQSWGGYQTAYLVTRTNMFAAAGAGAPVCNMISSYGGIRWKSGKSRAFMYEHTQSRIGKSLWDDGALDLYIENSPLFFADKVHTPLLITHNDADGAVPWYQGIEYFLALRRLERPVWMLSYHDEAHNLVHRKNRKDLSVKMLEFFEHYLKGAPLPEWMR